MDETERMDWASEIRTHRSRIEFMTAEKKKLLHEWDKSIAEARDERQRSQVLWRMYRIGLSIDEAEAIYSKWSTWRSEADWLLVASKFEIENQVRQSMADAAEHKPPNCA